MLAFRTYRSDWDFVAKIPETSDEYEKTAHVFLKDKVCVLTCSSDDSWIKIYPVIECDKNGLMEWDKNWTCWMPVSPSIAAAYTSYLAEKEILK